jgi:hypothetical protein
MGLTAHVAICSAYLLNQIFLTRKSSGGHQARKRKKGRKNLSAYLFVDELSHHPRKMRYLFVEYLICRTDIFDARPTKVPVPVLTEY